MNAATDGATEVELRPVHGKRTLRFSGNPDDVQAEAGSDLTPLFVLR